LIDRLFYREVEEYGKQKDGGGTDSFAVQRVQKAKLYHQQEQAQYPGKTGVQEILPARPQAYASQGNKNKVTSQGV
jgi:hypothetical protein